MLRDIGGPATESSDTTSMTVSSTSGSSLTSPVIIGPSPVRSIASTDSSVAEEADDATSSPTLLDKTIDLELIRSGLEAGNMPPSTGLPEHTVSSPSQCPGAPNVVDHSRPSTVESKQRNLLAELDLAAAAHADKPPDESVLPFGREQSPAAAPILPVHQLDGGLEAAASDALHASPNDPLFDPVFSESRSLASHTESPAAPSPMAPSSAAPSSTTSLHTPICRSPYTPVGSNGSSDHNPSGNSLHAPSSGSTAGSVQTVVDVSRYDDIRGVPVGLSTLGSASSSSLSSLSRPDEAPSLGLSPRRPYPPGAAAEACPHIAGPAVADSITPPVAADFAPVALTDRVNPMGVVRAGFGASCESVTPRAVCELSAGLAHSPTRSVALSSPTKSLPCERSELDEARVEMEDMRRNRLSLECDLLTVQAELERLRAEKDAEERRKERCERDVVQLRGELRFLTEANEASRSQIAELTLQREKAEREEIGLLAKRKSIETVRQQMALRESEHETTQAQLAQLGDELERLREHSNSELQLQKRRETELDEVRRESELLLQSREQSTSALHRARHELRKMIEQKARDESELQSEQLQLQRLRGEVSGLRSTKLSVDAELEECRTEAGRLRTEVADAEATLSSHRAQADQLRRQLQLAQESSSDALGQLGGMRESLRSLALVQGKEITGLRDDEDAIRQARAELHAIACQRDALATQLQALRSEVLMAEVIVWRRALQRAFHGTHTCNTTHLPCNMHPS